MNIKQRFAVSVLISLLLVFACAIGIGESLYNGFIYEEDADIVRITGWIKSDENMIVPGSINSKPVAIDACGLCDNQTVKTVDIQPGVVWIGENSFYGNHNLIKVLIPNSVKSIESFAFSDCVSLEYITIPNGLKKLNSCVLESCSSLKEIKLPESLEIIDNGAFDSSGLISIEIPKRVQLVKDNSFAHCTGLTDIYFFGYSTEITYKAFTSCSDALVIHGYEGSFAENFAKEMEMRFEKIPGQPTKPVTGVTLNTNSKTLAPDESFQLVATVKPDNADDKSVRFESSDTDVVTVNSNGLVTALSNGEATVTATTTDGGYTDTCRISVRDGVSGPDDMSFTYETDRMFIGNSYAPTVTFTPNGEYALKWKSSKPKIAKVYANGIVAPLKAGSTVITATTANSISYSRTVTVFNNNIAALKLDTAKVVIIKPGESLTVSITVEPYELASIAEITVKSSKPAVADITNHNNNTEENHFTLKAIKPGKSIITVKSGKVKAKFTVKVAKDKRITQLPTA